MATTEVERSTGVDVEDVPSAEWGWSKMNRGVIQIGARHDDAGHMCSANLLGDRYPPARIVGKVAGQRIRRVGGDEVEVGVAIEIDGKAHDMGDRPLRDQRRDAFLQSQGFAVLRLPATSILKDLNAAIEGIVAFCLEQPPLHHRTLSGGPPPRFGEVFDREQP